VAKQQEYKTITRLAGTLDPSYASAMRKATSLASQFMDMDAKGKAKFVANTTPRLKAL